jgi:hypothetical protein
LRTGLVWTQGDSPPPTRGKDDCCQDWATFLRCLLSDESLRQLLARNHLDARAIEKCFAQVCKQSSKVG